MQGASRVESNPESSGYDKTRIFQDDGTQGIKYNLRTALALMAQSHPYKIVWGKIRYMLRSPGACNDHL